MSTMKPARRARGIPRTPWQRREQASKAARTRWARKAARDLAEASNAAQRPTAPPPDADLGPGAQSFLRRLAAREAEAARKRVETGEHGKIQFSKEATPPAPPHAGPSLSAAQESGAQASRMGPPEDPASRGLT